MYVSVCERHVTYFAVPSKNQPSKHFSATKFLMLLRIGNMLCDRLPYRLQQR